ncbi:MAG: M48 family metallopeptidase [Deltaproteobacteria bacterium]|nr:M48 family metallopeptidase [Deltaproteobacteria bacterium]MBW2396282.1 M48 family metallopeptidase [Deltaproteobacteria bacterium]
MGEKLDRKTRNELMTRLNRDARFIATHFELRYRAIEAERANVKNRYGVCYSDGTIKIRLRHVTTGKPLKYSSLVATLCHELAHLRHFNHGLRFRSFNQTLLEFARGHGIYQPRRVNEKPTQRVAVPERTPAPKPSEPDGPRQLTLF